MCALRNMSVLCSQLPHQDFVLYSLQNVNAIGICFMLNVKLINYFPNLFFWITVSEDNQCIPLSSRWFLTDSVLV